MTDRTEMEANRAAGLRARHETREARAVRKAEEALAKAAREFAHAINSDLGEWSVGECRTFLRQFAAECQPLARQIGAEETPS